MAGTAVASTSPTFFDDEAFAPSLLPTYTSLMPEWGELKNIQLIYNILHVIILEVMEP